MKEDGRDVKTPKVFKQGHDSTNTQEVNVGPKIKQTTCIL